MPRLVNSLKVLMLACLLALAGCGGGGTGDDAGGGITDETGGGTGSADDGSGSGDGTGGTGDDSGSGDGTGGTGDGSGSGDGTGGTGDGGGDGTGSDAAGDTGDGGGDAIFTSDNPPEFVAIHPYDVNVVVGESTSVRVIATHDTGESADVTGLVQWESMDPDIVTVTGGVVTGVANGFGWIEASYFGVTGGILVSVFDEESAGNGGDNGDGGDGSDVAPEVSAGADQEAMAGETVTVTASVNSGADIESYEWTQTGGASASYEFNNATLTFDVPAASPGTQYTFQVEVTDSEGRQSSDSVIITVAAFSGAPVLTNPAGYGPDMVHYVRMGSQRAYLSEGIDRDGERTIYAVGESHEIFKEIFDPDGLLDNPSIQITLRGGFVDGLWGSYTNNVTSEHSAIYAVSAANQPMISHAFGDPADTSLIIRHGPVALPDAVYFTAQRGSIRGSGESPTYPVYKLDDGPTQIGSFDTPPYWYKYTTGKAMYVSIPGEIHKIHAGTVAEVTLGDGRSLDMWGWAGYGVTWAGEQAFVVGKPADEGLSYRLYKINGTHATELPGWTDYGTPALITRAAGINFVHVQSLSSGEDVLVGIDNDGTVEEFLPPAEDADGEPVDYTATDVRPLHADNNGTFFLVDGVLYFRNIKGWWDLGITTDRVVALESNGIRHYVMGGSRTYLETEFGITLPETEYGIYKVTLDMTSLIPQRELIWEARFDYAYRPVRLTYHGGNLYFQFDTSSAELRKTHHIPYGNYVVPR